jgi:peptide deformylase
MAIQCVTDVTRCLAHDMLYTLGDTTMSARIGVGLSAPQVGHCVRLVVIAAPGWPEFAMVNPVIERGKGWKLGEESCLSLPGVKGQVGRFATIDVMYETLDGSVKNLRAKDFLARVVQHEVDHLDGIEFTDRMEEQRKGGR